MSRQIFEYHPVVGYRFVPGLRARVPHEAGGYLIRTNALGFRCDHDLTAPPPVGSRRVLLFGDSFTAGDGVSNSQRFGDLLEQRIAGLEVGNFGLPGTGTDQHYLTWREFARELPHDLLIIAVQVENVRRVAARYRLFLDDRGAERLYAKPYFVLEAGRLDLRNVPVPREALDEADLPEADRPNVDRGGRFEQVRRVVNQLGLREMVQRVTHYQPVPEYDRPDDPAWSLMRALLERWVAESPRPVLLVPLPLYQFVEQTADPSGYQARFVEVAAATGCTLHDPLPDLLRHSREARRAFRFQRDPHPTREGHAALAASLEPVLSGLLAGRCASAAR